MIARLLARERTILFVLIGLQAAAVLFLVAGRRAPRIHDTFSYYVSQYLTQCHVSTEGELPLWAPYASHGRSTGPEPLRQASLVQAATLALGGLPEGTPFLPWFYFSFWIEELLLLAGMWRLGARLGWGPAARAIVAAAAAGTDLWIDQLMDHRSLCFLPLALSLLHDVLDGGPRWTLYALAGWMALHFFGGTLYGAFLDWLVLLVYAAVHLRGRVAPLAPRFRPRPADAAVLAVLLLLGAAALVSLLSGASDLHLERAGRGALGGVSLDNFLTHGLSLHPARYLDLVAGVSPSLDFVLYLGPPVVAFAVLGLLSRPGREVRTLVLCLGLSFFFSIGVHGLVAFAAYFGFPPMMYYRHAATGSVLVRLFLLLLAGQGVEAWLRGRSSPAAHRALAMAAGGLATVLAAAALAAARDPAAAETIVGILRTPLTMYPACPETQEAGRVAALLAGAAAAAVGTLLLFRRPPGAVAAAWALVLVAGDAQRWRFQMLKARTTPATVEDWSKQWIRRVPFVERRRSPGLEDHRKVFGGSFVGRGSAYDYLAGYLGVDFVSSSLETGHWQESVERLRRAAAPRAPGAPGYDSNFFPDPPASLRKVLGETDGKLRFFARAHRAADETVLARWLSHPRFDGDALLLGPGPGPEAPESGPDPPPGGRRELSYRIVQAGANGLVLETEAPEGTWLSYADAWDPGWTAAVNGRPVPVERAYLAYKAVRLDPGPNRVEFRFRGAGRSRAFFVVAFYSLACLAGLAAWGVRGLLRRPAP